MADFKPFLPFCRYRIFSKVRILDPLHVWLLITIMDRKYSVRSMVFFCVCAFHSNRCCQKVDLSRVCFPERRIIRNIAHKYLSYCSFPCFENPYPMTVHESPVTHITYITDCADQFIPQLYSIGSKQKRQAFSDKVKFRFWLNCPGPWVGPWDILLILF